MSRQLSLGIVVWMLSRTVSYDPAFIMSESRDRGISGKIAELDPDIFLLPLECNNHALCVEFYMDTLSSFGRQRNKIRLSQDTQIHQYRETSQSSNSQLLQQDSQNSELHRQVSNSFQFNPFPVYMVTTAERNDCFVVKEEIQDEFWNVSPENSMAIGDSTTLAASLEEHDCDKAQTLVTEIKTEHAEDDEDAALSSNDTNSQATNDSGEEMIDDFVIEEINHDVGEEIVTEVPEPSSDETVEDSPSCGSSSAVDNTGDGQSLSSPAPKSDTIKQNRQETDLNVERPSPPPEHSEHTDESNHEAVGGSVGREAVPRGVENMNKQSDANVSQTPSHSASKLQSSHAISEKRDTLVREPIERPHKCDVCHKRFRHPCVLREHHSRIHTDHCPYRCKKCGQKFKYKNTYERHVDDHQGKKTYYICDICDAPCSSQSNLLTHKKCMHSNERPYICGHCDRAFKNKSVLKLHLLTHSQTKPNRCKICGRGFIQTGGLKLHMRVHNDERPYKCTTCPKSFREKKKLVLHERVHSGDKPFSCKYCEKEFADPSACKRHLRVHTGETPYHCCYCPKKFNDTGARTRHERIHTGEKPCKCKVCDKDFLCTSILTAHMKTVHSEKRPFKCNLCPKAFKTKQNIKLHMDRMHIGDSIHKCKLCGLKFKLRRHVKEHMKCMHSAQKQR